MSSIERELVYDLWLDPTTFLFIFFIKLPQVCKDTQIHVQFMFMFSATHDDISFRLCKGAAPGAFLQSLAGYGDDPYSTVHMAIWIWTWIPDMYGRPAGRPWDPSISAKRSRAISVH